MQHPDSNDQFQMLQRSLSWDMQKGSQIPCFQFLCSLDISLEPKKQKIQQFLQNVDQSHDQFE